MESRANTEDAVGTWSHPAKDVDDAEPVEKQPCVVPLSSGTNESLGSASQSAHPVFGTTYHRRLNYHGEFCRRCLYDKVSIDARFQSAWPFCERCGEPWTDPYRGPVPHQTVMVWDEEKVSESALADAMYGCEQQKESHEG